MEYSQRAMSRENVTTLDEKLLKASELLAESGETEKAEEVFRTAVEKATQKSWEEVKAKIVDIESSISGKEEEIVLEKNELNEWKSLITEEVALGDSLDAPVAPEENTDESTTETLVPVPKAEIEVGDNSPEPIARLLLDHERISARDDRVVAKRIENGEVEVAERLEKLKKSIDHRAGAEFVRCEMLTLDELEGLDDFLHKAERVPSVRYELIMDLLAYVKDEKFMSKFTPNEQARIRYAIKKHGDMSPEDWAEQGFNPNMERNLVALIRERFSKRLDHYVRDIFVENIDPSDEDPLKYAAEIYLLREVVPAVHVDVHAAYDAGRDVLERTDKLALKLGGNQIAEYGLQDDRRFLRGLYRPNNDIARRGAMTPRQAEVTVRIVTKILARIPDLYELTSDKPELKS